MTYIVIDFRPVFLVIGLLLIILALGMGIPAIVDLSIGNPDWTAFATAGAFTLFVGTATVMTTRTGEVTLTLRQAFLLTTLSWIVLPAFASLPFMISDYRLNFTDAFFEAMSGITTTGATVITNLDAAPPGLLLWRGILQWLGGLGIIIMALTILPMLKVGGMQMFKVEGFEAQEKVLPRATQVAAALVIVFVFLTALWALFYWLAGMGTLDATVHAMTTIATGGYSNHDASMGYFDSGLIDALAIIGMVVGGIPFLLYVQVIRGRSSALWNDSQVRWFISTVITFVGLVTVYLVITDTYEPVLALRFAAFNTVSVITGTGFATADFSLWGGFVLVVLFMLMFIGGCAGSTTCGIKVFRFQVLFEVARVQLRQLLEPHGVFTPYYNGRSIDESVAASVMGFFYLYALTVCVLGVALAALGLDFITAISGAASAVSNVGPGLGPIIGPAGTYATLPDAAKWLLALGMLLGRLELYTVLVLVLPRFWRG
ncbi:MAG: TrkH family potassium uptake protein [Rhodospirillaceae bacterium]